MPIAMKPVAMRIERRGDKWAVLPEEGDHVLGTHDTREQAEAQLAAIEASKARAAKAHSMTARMGATVAFDASPSPQGPLPVNRWDRFATWGPKDKDGPTEFNEETLGQMVGNWRQRAMRLAMCQDHKSTAAPFVAAPAMAFYDALAVVREGKVIHFERLAGSNAAEPVVAALKEQVARFATEENPSPEPDGMWGWRREITPLGEDPREGLRNYRGLSPLFDPNGKDEQGNPIGYVLLDVAATNTTFQAGCEITFGAVSMSSLNEGDQVTARHDRGGVKAGTKGKVTSANGPLGTVWVKFEGIAGETAWPENALEKMSATAMAAAHPALAPLLDCATCGQRLADVDFDGKLPNHNGRDGKPCAGSETNPSTTVPSDGAGNPIAKGEHAMNEEMLKKFGLTAESTPEEQKEGIKKFCAGYAAKLGDAPAEELEAGAKDLLEVAGKLEGEDGEAMKKLSAKMSHMAKFGAVEEKKPEALAATEGALHDAKLLGEDEEKAKAEMAMSMGMTGQVTLRQLAQAFSARTAPLSEMGAVKNRVVELESQLAARVLVEKKAAAQAFSAKAVTEGRTIEEKRAAIEEIYLTSGEKAAEAQLFAMGQFTLGRRMTAGGHPVGKPEMPVSTFEADSPEAIELTIRTKALEMQAKNKAMSFSAACSEVLKADPELKAQYLASHS